MYNIYDPLSDMINRIVMSQKKNLTYLFVYFSNINLNILKTLKSNGYISKIFLFNFNFKLIIVKLKYYNKKPCIRIFKRISKSSFRVYMSYKTLPKIMNNFGILLLSTSKFGIITDKEAKTLGIGGEIICYVF